MPARLAAMPRTPPARGACGDGARVIERLTVTGAGRATTGAGRATTGAGRATGAGAGLGLTTPVKPMFPKVWGASGAWAGAGAATATARATGSMALVVGVSAAACRARAATMAPENTITAEALLAGFAEREIADENDDPELTECGARWRPALWLDIVKDPLQTPTRSAVGFGWENCTRPSCQQIDRVVCHQEGFTPRSVFRRPKMWVPRSCQADVESLECGDRTRRTASSTAPKIAKPDHRT